jgi:transglutaminase-like putative cysteine protease
MAARWFALIDQRETWRSSLLFAVMFLSVVWAIEGAHWVKEMPGLSGFVVVALFISMVLSRLKLPALVIHPLGMVIGLLMCGWLIVESAGGAGFPERLADALVRLVRFSNVIASNGINTDGLPFSAQIVLLTWFVAYLSVWCYYRYGNMWLGVLPAGVGLAVNLTYSPASFATNLALYLFCALVLMMELHRMRQKRRWQQSQVPDTELQYSANTGPVVLFAGAILSVAFLAPLIGQSVPIALAWEQATGPWRTFERQFDRLFASVSSGTVAPLHSFGRVMPFKGAVSFGDQNPLAQRLGLARDVVLYVKAEESGYWRAESYAEYTSGGWLSSNRIIRGVARDSLPGGVEEYKERKAFQQTIQFVQPLDVIPVRGMPLYGSQPANGETAPAARYTLDLADSRQNNGLPPDLQRLARDLAVQLGRAGLVNQSQAQRLLPADLRVERLTRRNAEVVSAEVSRTDPFPPDYSSIRPVTNAQGGQGFSVVSSVSKAPVDVLRAASGEAPGWVKDQYLQLPSTLPARVRQLAREWTDGAGNNFDRALAVESKLREFPYTTNIPAPPRDTDGVDFFLFDLKRGYADYHSSAMAVLLRSVGIPARVAVGYVSGEYDAEKEHYVVREVHAHAWVEAFFPGYGWIDFNPTPNWPTPPRIYDTGDLTAPEDDAFSMDGSATIDDTGEPMIDDAAAAAAQQQEDFNWLLRLAALLGLLALGFWLTLRWVWGYGLRGLSFPAQTYEKMCRLAALGRFGPQGRETPQEYARALALAVPEVGGQVAHIAAGYNRSRYGAGQPSPVERQELRQAWLAVRKALLSQAMGGWWRRFRER